MIWAWGSRCIGKDGKLLLPFILLYCIFIIWSKVKDSHRGFESVHSITSNWSNTKAWSAMSIGIIMRRQTHTLTCTQSGSLLNKVKVHYIVTYCLYYIDLQKVIRMMILCYKHTLFYPNYYVSLNPTKPFTLSFSSFVFLYYLLMRTV